MVNKIYKYCNLKVDTDFSTYFETKSCVKFRCCNKIEKKIDEYRKLIVQTYYIKYNCLYFTYRGAMYETRISHSADEYNYIEFIVCSIKRLGAKDIVYLQGELD